MTPSEKDLKRALNARSAGLPPEFGSRLARALTEPRSRPNFTSALALVTALVIATASIGTLLAVRSFDHQGLGIASGSRLNSPSPTPTGNIDLPTTVVLSAPSHDVVWAFVGETLLFVSTDRGDTWQQRALPKIGGGGGPIEISFVDKNQGWLAIPGVPETQCNAAGVTIWHTIDGARTWHLLSTTGISDRQCKFGLSFIDPTDGFISGWDDNHPPVVYRTHDGGLTWNASQPLADPPGFKTYGAGDALRVNFVVGFEGKYLLTTYGMQPDGPHAYVFLSVDGGATWNYQARLLNPADSVGFVTESRWLQLITPGQSFETTDAGKTWHPYASDYNQAAPIAPELVFGDSSVGYATVRGGIERTIDGGLHWTVIRTPGVVYFGYYLATPVGARKYVEESFACAVRLPAGVV